MLKITGLFGHPLKHSLSPQMHNAAFRALGMTDWEYELFDFSPEELPAKMQMLREDASIQGVNVTVPYKIAVLQYLDQIDPLANKIGAVNTIKKSGAKLIGYNTDAPGFYGSLTEDAGWPKGKVARKVLLLGAGGAARSVLFILQDLGLFQELYIYDVIAEAAEKLVLSAGDPGGRVKTAMADQLQVLANGADLIINASGTGSSHSLGASPLPGSVFHEGQMVYDLGYNPKETELMRIAKLESVRTCNGLGMLIRQGALAFEIFTGIRPAVEVMRRAAGG
ncbi:MAG: shikimate dehydrogenase [Candidatus Margulisiibacteriota bacterium]|jgi:shikimate dehydrogenase